jgi:hypothetical protein
MDTDNASSQEVTRTVIYDDSELLKLKKANKELFHYAVSNLLQNKDK